MLLACMLAATVASLSHGTVIDVHARRATATAATAATAGVPFLGVGAISGGGATSRLLQSYPEPQRGQILDYLFKPQFGAALSILKVEIGGDAQSTDGTEPSHRHVAGGAPDYTRGYEWWLMTEAKKRNPDIKLWALPWAFPGWLDPSGGNNPYASIRATAAYVGEWVRAARSVHNLTIDWVGCWNERPYNASYLRALRADLDASPLSRGTRIVAPDGFSVEQLAGDMLGDPTLFAAVGALGSHYPGGKPSSEALLNVSRRGKPLVASEDYGVYFAPSGGKALARLVNRNAVVGARSATVASGHPRHARMKAASAASDGAAAQGGAKVGASLGAARPKGRAKGGKSKASAPRAPERTSAPQREHQPSTAPSHAVRSASGRSTASVGKASAVSSGNQATVYVVATGCLVPAVW